MIGTHKVYIIAGVDEEFGLGKQGDLAWKLQKDMDHFKTVTTNVEETTATNAVIMGRTTWESLPASVQPLPDRFNIVLTTDVNFQPKGAEVARTIDDALDAADLDEIETIFIIGGAKVYEEAINHEAVDGIYLTHISGTHDCDVFFPAIPEQFSEVETLGHEEEGDTELEFSLYRKDDEEEVE